MRVTKEMLQAIGLGANYIVMYPSEELKDKVSKHYNGYWYNRPEAKFAYNPNIHERIIAEHNGDYEFRDDGAVAEVWVVRRNPDYEGPKS
jgi:hypothetical protein